MFSFLKKIELSFEKALMSSFLFWNPQTNRTITLFFSSLEFWMKYALFFYSIWGKLKIVKWRTKSIFFLTNENMVTPSKCDQGYFRHELHQKVRSQRKHSYNPILHWSKLTFLDFGTNSVRKTACLLFTYLSEPRFALACLNPHFAYLYSISFEND